MSCAEGTTAGRQTGVGSAATGRINFPLYEKVVHVPQTERVKQARAEHYEPDILGVKGPTWNHSVEAKLPHTQKHNTYVSDSKLSNTLRPELLNAQDSRTLAGTTHFKADRTAAFDRGEVTVGGWDKSTAQDEPAIRRARETELLEKSLANTMKTTQKLASTGAYVTPTQRVQALTDSMRKEKEQAAQEYAALVERYGEEGAKVMTEMQKLPKNQTKPGGRATKADISAVLSLPDYGDDEDEQ